ncbi:MAG: Lysine exporter protein (LYSE/YGGA) [candidate division TA06 bacterium 34_109]|uniref:Lysine exporter protein (LYSE/YGGA) n=1 Tax=candidate division TA06 bacterium 34_109 TaxID=1635277 RepID=A0A117M5N7_UNCT6|nr:MAG: Lysine exporter protein (LYSE/YGGA) [candidate division TA06 bacterium 34_109]
MDLIDFDVLIPFVLITTFTPGPNNLSSASMSINFGIKKTMNYIYGIVTGFFLLLLLCGFFSNLLFTAVPSMEPIMWFEKYPRHFYFFFFFSLYIISSAMRINSSIDEGLTGS